MIKEINFPNAYKEVYTILKCVDEEDVKAISKEFIELIENNMNRKYEFEYNPEIDFKDQNLLRETKAIFAYIYLNFWANDQQKQIINLKFRQDIEEEEDAKRKNYNPYNLFKKKKEEKQTEKMSLKLVEKKNFFMRCIEKLKALFIKGN